MQLDPPPRVIFSPEDAEHWIAETRAWICQGQTPCPQDEDYIVGNTGLPVGAEAYWRPSRSEVRRFERKLALRLSQMHEQYRHDPPGPLWQYSVQYIGYVKDGERLIYANGACGYQKGVREQWFFIMDGGTCVFGASFNPRTGELFGPGFNGYA